MPFETAAGMWFPQTHNVAQLKFDHHRGADYSTKRAERETRASFDNLRSAEYILFAHVCIKSTQDEDDERFVRCFDAGAHCQRPHRD